MFERPEFWRLRRLRLRRPVMVRHGWRLDSPEGYWRLFR